MKADIEWVEKLGNQLKRKTRITFVSHGKIKWQFKQSDADRWDYDTPPTASDWAILEEKVSALYNRRRIPFKNLELVRLLRQKAENGQD